MTQPGSEFLANVIAALFASILVANFSSQLTILSRWLPEVSIGPMGWLTLSFNQGLWYRFPMPFLLDGLGVSLAERAVAGLAIALIVRSAPIKSQILFRFESKTPNKQRDNEYRSHVCSSSPFRQ